MSRSLALIDKPEGVTLHAHETLKLRCEMSGTAEVNLYESEDDSIYRQLALVDVADPNGAQKYNAKLKSLRNPDSAPDQPCAMKFLAAGISDSYLKLMRGLQFLEPVAPAELVDHAQRITNEEMWVRSRIDRHTPLEAAIAATFASDFGSEVADQIIDILVQRGAPLNTALSGSITERGGPTSNPLHMLAGRGDFSKLTHVLQVARDAGRLGHANRPHTDVFHLLFGDIETLKHADTPELDEQSAAYTALSNGLIIKLLQHAELRDLLDSFDKDRSVATRSALALSQLRAAALGIVSRNVDEFAALFAVAYEHETAANAVAGLPLHRICDGGAASKFPLKPAHARKLIELLPVGIIKKVDGGGRTALHAAISAGNVDVVDAMLARCPDLAGVPTVGRTVSRGSAETFEEYRRNAIKHKSKRWGAEHSDPAGHLAPASRETRRFPLQLACECRRPDKLGERMAHLILSKIGDSSDNTGFSGRDEAAAVLDECLSECVVKQFSGSIISDILELFVGATSSSGRSNNNKVYPTRAITAAILKGDTSFLDKIRSKSELGGTLDILLTPQYRYHQPLSALIDDWESNSSSRNRHTKDGLRKLVGASSGAAASSVQKMTDDSNNFHVSRVGGQRGTPVLLALVNRDAKMVEYLIRNCGCSADASFLADFYLDGRIDFTGEDGYDASEPKLSGDAARVVCAPHYLSRLFESNFDFDADQQHSRGGGAETKSRSLVFSTSASSSSLGAAAAADASASYQILRTLVESSGSSSSSLNLHEVPLCIRYSLLASFLNSTIPKMNDGATAYFVGKLGLFEIDRIQLPGSKNRTLFRHISKSPSHVVKNLPPGLVKQWILANADDSFNSWWRDDEEEGDDGKEAKQDAIAGFDASSPVSNAVMERHPLVSYILGDPHNPLSRVSSITYALASAWNETDVTNRSEFCKHVVREYWTRDSTSNASAADTRDIRSVLFKWCNDVSIAMNARRQQQQQTPLEFLLDHVADHKASGAGDNTPIGKLDGVDNAATAARLLATFASSFKQFASKGTQRWTSTLLRYSNDSGVCSQMEEIFGDDNNIKKTIAMYALSADKSFDDTFSRYKSALLAEEDPNLTMRVMIRDGLVGFENDFLPANGCGSDGNPFEFFLNPAGPHWMEMESSSTQKFFNFVHYTADTGVDDVLVKHARTFFSSSSSKKDEYAQQWQFFHRLEALLVQVVNASRWSIHNHPTAAVAQQQRRSKPDVVSRSLVISDSNQQQDAADSNNKIGKIPTLIAFLMDEAAASMPDDDAKIKFYLVLYRVASCTGNIPMIERLGQVRRQLFADGVLAGADSLHEELEKSFDPDAAPAAKKNDDEDEDDEDDMNEPVPFTWGGMSSAVFRGGMPVFLAVKAACASIRSFSSDLYAFPKYCERQSLAPTITEEFVEDIITNAASMSSDDLSARVTALWTKLAETTQIRLLDAIDKNCSADTIGGVLEAIMEKSWMGASNKLVAVARMLQIAQSKQPALLGTMWGNQHGDRAGDAVVYCCAVQSRVDGKRIGFDLVRDQASFIREFEGFSAQTGGKILVHDSVLAFEPELLSPNASMFAGLFAWCNDKSSGDVPAEEDEEDDEYGCSSTPTTPYVFNPDDVFSKITYGIRNHGRVPQLTGAEVKARIERTNYGGSGIEVDPAVCSNSVIQANAHKITVPFDVEAIIAADADAFEATNFTEDEALDGLSRGRLRVELLSSSYGGGGGSSDPWAELAFSDQMLVLKLKPSALDGDKTKMEDLVIQDRLRQLLDFIYSPKLFPGSLGFLAREDY